MKNKGFVLMETIVVIVVISVALLTIFSSYSKILSKVKSENKYDTSEYIYMTKYIKDNLRQLCGYSEEEELVNNIGTVSNIYNYAKCNGDGKFTIFNVEKIYILTNWDTAGNNIYKFDAYMIDYIRKLDVNDNDQLIIVEYKRPAIKTNYNPKTDTKGNQLYETYIASLEW